MSTPQQYREDDFLDRRLTIPTLERRRVNAQKFRKRPVVIEAMQWDGGAAAATPIIDWALSNGGTIRYREPVDIDTAADQFRIQGEHLRVVTIEGTMTANVGDWIVRGVKGEFRPCKPDIFAATYEPVVEVAE